VARVQLFLSTVTAEFLSYRERLRHQLSRPDVEVKVQDDFIVTGDGTLEMLDAYIQGCDGVIHLVGDMTGAMAPRSPPPSGRPRLSWALRLSTTLLGKGPMTEHAACLAQAWRSSTGPDQAMDDRSAFAAERTT
jgi:hypothetical protein